MMMVSHADFVLVGEEVSRTACPLCFPLVLLSPSTTIISPCTVLLASINASSYSRTNAIAPSKQSGTNDIDIGSYGSGRSELPRLHTISLASPLSGLKMKSCLRKQVDGISIRANPTGQHRFPVLFSI